MKSPISVCIITKNEELNLARCLKSVSWADEIIVVDSGSTDKTVSIAKEHGATVHVVDWKGWAKQKNTCIKLASSDWVLSLDADEWLPANSEKIIRKTINSDSADGYTLGRRTTFLGKWISHAGWYPDRQIRLFRKSVTAFAEVAVHEKVIVPARHADLSLDMWHESYVSLEQFVEKNNKYSSAQAELQKDQSQLLLKLILKPWYRFLQTYMWQLGFLDGREGFILCVLRMWYEFVVIAKIMQLRKASSKV